MKIIIKKQNEERIKSALEAVQKRTKVRNVDVNNIYKMVEEIEKKLEIPETSMLGIKADVDYNAQNFCRAYRYIPESTHVCLEKFVSGWGITGIERRRCRPSRSKYVLSLTEHARSAICCSKISFS